MRKLLLLLAIAVAVSLPGLAQAAGGQTNTTESTTTTKTKTKKSGTPATEGQASATTAGTSTKGAAKESQLTGCLAKSADGNGFTLTNGKYTSGVAVKSDQDLSGHVGHKVKLMGTWEKPTAGEKGGAGAKGETMRTFNATSMKHIADTCSATAGGGHKGGKKGAAEKPSGK